MSIDEVAGSRRRAVASACAEERERLLARVRDAIIPGLERLADPTADPAVLVALADHQSRDLRAELERIEDAGPTGRSRADDAACAAEREWVRGHLHDTALQILEFIAGDGFGTGLAAEKIASLAGGAAHDLHRWVESVGAPDDGELLAELERITAQARAMDGEVELVVGEIASPPTSAQVEALAGAVREAVTNARKHAHASQVVVRVQTDDRGCTAVTVADDGVGIDLKRAERGRGLGVKGSIVGRMRRVGGDASLCRAPGGGTLVTLVTRHGG